MHVAVTKVKLGAQAQGGQWNKEGVREYEEEWLVHVSSQQDSMLTVLNDGPALGLPVLFDRTFLGLDGRADTDALCIRVQPRRDPNTPFLWRVGVSYSNDCGPKAEGEVNPLLRPPTIDWSPNTFQQPAVWWYRTALRVGIGGVQQGNPNITVDDPDDWTVGDQIVIQCGTQTQNTMVNGVNVAGGYITVQPPPAFDCTKPVITITSRIQPVTNSAGQLPDPPLEKDATRFGLVITRNEACFDPNLALTYQDATNADAISIAGLITAPLQAKVNIGSRREMWKGAYYYATSYHLAFRKETWVGSMQDQGCYQLDATTGKLKNCTDFYQRSVTAPVALDGKGHQLLPNGEGFDPARDWNKIVYRKGIIYEVWPFAALALPVNAL